MALHMYNVFCSFVSVLSMDCVTLRYLYIGILSSLLITLTFIEPSQSHKRRCRIHNIVHKIQVPYCQPKRLLSFACLGSCKSYSGYSKELAEIKTHCSCCQPTGGVVRRIHLNCRTRYQGPWSKEIVQVSLPTGCMCRPCSDTRYTQPEVPTGPSLLDRK